MILIVSFPDNEHVAQVRRQLTSDSVVVDIGSFPVSMSLDARFSNQAESIRLALPEGGQLYLGEVGAVWYRRLSSLGIDPALTDETSRIFAWSESNEALLGVWYSLDCFWMNPPLADEVSQRKIRQLQVARSVGLTIPDTLFTNDPNVARDFIQLQGPGNVIRKAFRNISQAPRETSKVSEHDLEVIDSVKYAPVIFQRFVPAEFDLRITVVEDDIFAASIRSQPEYQTDYRGGLGSAVVEECSLPDEVETQLMDLMRTFQIQYGAIDMRVTPEGEYVFLEVNPAGEFLYISQRTGQPIPQAIAASLERHDKYSR